MDLEERTDRIVSEYEQLPDVEEPPLTFLKVLNRQRRENFWNSILSYFLDPNSPHGLGKDFLEMFLDILRENESSDFQNECWNTEKVEVKSEVSSGEGNRPDILIRYGEEWFILIELKVKASEGKNQTKRYANSDSIDGLNKSKFGDQGYYVYLSPRTQSPSSDRFTNLDWTEIVEKSEKLIEKSRGRYPEKSINQLRDLIDTVKEELDMTSKDYEENQRKKIKIYLENSEPIDELKEAFETLHEEEQEKWREKFLEFYKPDNWSEKWNCDPRYYGQIYMDQWRRDENLEETKDGQESKVALQFVHLIRDEDSFKDGKLTFELRWPGGGEYFTKFKENFLDNDEAMRQLEERDIKQVRDSSLRLTTKEYSFDQSDLPKSYYKKLKEAFEEHKELKTVINRILEESLGLEK